MIRRPPRSTRTDTLFPYETLFRSPAAERPFRWRQTIRDRYGVGDGWIVGILADLRHQPRKGGGWLDTLREPLPLTRPSESALGVQRPYSGAGFVLWRSGAGRCWISVPRSEERRVGSECVSPGRSGWRQSRKKQKETKKATAK